MKINYLKTWAHGYTYWYISIDGKAYRENGHKRLFSTRRDAQTYVANHIG